MLRKERRAESGYISLDLLDEMFKDKLEDVEVGWRKPLNQVPEGEQSLTAILNVGDVCQLIHLIHRNEGRQSLGEEIFESCCDSIHWNVQFPDRNGGICERRERRRKADENEVPVVLHKSRKQGGKKRACRCRESGKKRGFLKCGSQLWRTLVKLLEKKIDVSPIPRHSVKSFQVQSLFLDEGDTLLHEQRDQVVL